LEAIRNVLVTGSQGLRLDLVVNNLLGWGFTTGKIRIETGQLDETLRWRKPN